MSAVRRRTDPYMTQRIWDSITFLIRQRNPPTNDGVTRHLSRIHCMTESEAQEELDKAVEDGLVVRKKSPTKKIASFESVELALPTELSPDEDSHDWYCCECQKAGQVQCCKQCYRVFHPDCHKPSDPESNACSFCEKFNSEEEFADKATLNVILKFACSHMKAKLPMEITNRTIVFDGSETVVPTNGLSGPTWVSEGEDAWRPDMLIKNHMDLAIMDLKTSRNEYKKLAEFEADAHNIFHNIIIYHGGGFIESSIIGDMGRTMYKDCLYDLKEIRRCPDCYRISNEKTEKMWFSIPCNPPHQLVYAKQKGYSYWPAKVMKIEDDVYDVRFFGGHHGRANIEKNFIRPITVNLSSLQIKRSTTWNKAYEELKHHQNRLKKTGGEKIAYGGFEKEWRRPSKIRKVDKSTVNKKLIDKQVTKDLRVKVERLNASNHSDAKQATEKDQDKGESSSSSSSQSRCQSEERQVPELPIAEDEPATDISSTCPQGLKKEGSQEDMVTSSSQEPRYNCVHVQTDSLQIDHTPQKQTKRDKKSTEQPLAAALEKLRREMELDKCRELERLQAEHASQLRELIEKNQQFISEIKKKQWCYNCEAEAIYHCCWNTAYCSTDCQQAHWQREHKRTCRRKR